MYNLISWITKWFEIFFLSIIVTTSLKYKSNLERSAVTIHIVNAIRLNKHTW